MQFDFISDPEIWAWEKEPDYTPVDWAAWQRASGADTIIIGGDIHRDPARVAEELKKAALAYKHILYYDGNQEHAEFPHDFHYAPETIRALTLDQRNITYLGFDREFIRDGVAIVGCNGWWDFKFAPGYTPGWDSLEQIAESRKLVIDGVSRKVTLAEAAAMADRAKYEAQCLAQTVTALQSDARIHTIVVATHTLPRRELIARGGPDFDPRRYGHAGNSHMSDVLAADTHHKIKLWLYGHLHRHTENDLDGILYICHARGTPGDKPPAGFKPLTLQVKKDFAGPKPAATVKTGQRKAHEQKPR